MFFLKPNAKVPGGVIGQPGEEELVGFRNPARRTSQAFPFQVFAYGEQYLRYGAFDPRLVHPVFGRRGSFQIIGPPLRQLHGKGELLVGCNSPVS